MCGVRFGGGLVLVLSAALTDLAGAQSIELTQPLARGNLFRGSATLTPDGRWVVFAGRYFSSGPGINSLYGRASDASSDPFLLYDHGDIPGVDMEFDPGTVTFVRVTPDSKWALFTVDERGTIYSARLSGGHVLPVPPNRDPFLRLAQADTARDFQITPDGSRAVFFGERGVHSVLVDVPGSSVEIVPDELDGSFGHRVQAFAIDATSTRVVFTLADEGSTIPRRLFSVPIDGGEPPTRLSPHVPRAYAGTPPGGSAGAAPTSLSVAEFQLAADGQTVLFLLEETRGDCAIGCVVVTHLYAVPTDGSSAARPLASGDVREAAFTPDSRSVVYRVTPASGGPTVLLAHPLDGSAPLRLHEPADAVQQVALLDDSVLFVEAPSGAGGDGLFRVPMDGSRGARQVSDALPAGRTIRAFLASPDGQHVVYSADAAVPGVFTLFAGPAAFERVRAVGSRPPRGVHAIGGNADVARFVFTPDSTAVLAHVASPEGLCLERARLDGSVRRLSGSEGASDLALDDAGVVAMYRGAREHDTREHVYTVRLDRDEAPVQVDDFGPELGSLATYEIHPNGREVVFGAGSRDFTFSELHRVPLDLSARPRRLEGLLVEDEYLLNHRIEPRSDRILYTLQEPDPFGYFTKLYSAPLDGSAPRVRLDQGEARVLDYRLAGDRVLYRKDTNPPREHFEVFSVPPDGSSAPQVLNGTLPVNDGRVYAYEVSPDATRVVYVASQNRSNRPEIFSVPTDGSQTPVQLNPMPVAGGEVWRGGFRISPDGARVVFPGDLTLNNAFSLWVAPIGGGAPAQVLWNAPATREVERLEVTSDSARAVFTADGIVNARYQLYVAPLDASAPAAPLPATAGTPRVYEFHLTPDGTRAVYMAGGTVVASVLVDGSAAPVVLNPPLAADRRVANIPAVTNEWVLYRADQDVARRYDLFAVPIDGSLPARLVYLPPGSDGPVEASIVGGEIVLLAQATPTYGSWQVFRAPLAGSRPTRALNPPGTFSYPYGSRLSTFLAHPDQHRVLFVAHDGGIGLDSGTHLFLGFLGQPIRGADRP